MCGLLLLLICGFMLYNMAAVYKRKADSKEFVDRLIEHADEATVDFEDSGLVFSAVEEGNMLIVTDADGWRFCYQTSKKYGDQLVRIEGSVERITGEEATTGSLEIIRRRSNYAYVVIKHDGGIRTLNYRVPEFDQHEKKFSSEKTAVRINQWISNEELAALYKKGKELEEILSAYCGLKSHNVDVSIHHYASP